MATISLWNGIAKVFLCEESTSSVAYKSFLFVGQRTSGIANSSVQKIIEQISVSDRQLFFSLSVQHKDLDY